MGIYIPEVVGFNGQKAQANYFQRPIGCGKAQHGKGTGQEDDNPKGPNPYGQGSKNSYNGQGQKDAHEDIVNVHIEVYTGKISYIPPSQIKQGQKIDLAKTYDYQG